LKGVVGISLSGKFKCSLSLLKNLKTIRVAVMGRKVNALALCIGLDKIGVLDFLEEPRTLSEVSSFIGNVKREDVLRELLEVLVDESVLVKQNAHYKVNRAEVERLHEMRRSGNMMFRDSEPLLSGFEKVLYEIMVDVLRGAGFDFVAPEVATLFYIQTASEAYGLGRRLLLELGGGKASLKGRKILDLGCGFGVEPITILNYLEFDCHLVCADFFPNVVDECMHAEVKVNGESKRLKDLENVEFVKLDPSMRKPFPIPDEYVDAVFSFQVLHWSSHPQEIICEAARTMKSKGTFMTATPMKKREKSTTTDVIVKLLGGNKTYSEEELKGFFEEAGLKKYSFFLSNFAIAVKN